MVSLYYKSEYLKEFYEKVYIKLKEIPNKEFSEKYALLTVTNILSELGDGEKILDVYDDIKDEPLLYLCLDFQATCFLNIKDEGKKEKRKIQELSKKIRDRIIKGKSLYLDYFKPSRIEKKTLKKKKEHLK